MARRMYISQGAQCSTCYYFWFPSIWTPFFWGLISTECVVAESCLLLKLKKPYNLSCPRSCRMTMFLWLSDPFSWYFNLGLIEETTEELLW